MICALESGRRIQDRPSHDTSAVSKPNHKKNSHQRALAEIPNGCYILGWLVDQLFQTNHFKSPAMGIFTWDIEDKYIWDIKII
jgi:hypothetical protein